MMVIKQLDAMDCGPACLAMVVKYYGRHPDRGMLRKLCDLGKDGVSLLDVSKAAEQIGFKTVGRRLTFDSLATEAPLPCIAHWIQNHFVVVHKVKKRRKGKYTIYVANQG